MGESSESKLRRLPPSPQFLSVAQHLARIVGLDAQRVARGSPMLYSGLIFWLRHQGPSDPDGLEVVVKLGDGGDAENLRALLRQNYLAPAGASSYHAMLPDSTDIVRCLRIDLSKATNPTAEIVSYIEITVAMRDQVMSAVEAQFERLQPMHPGMASSPTSSDRSY